MGKNGITWALAVALAGAIATGAVGVFEARAGTATNQRQDADITSVKVDAATVKASNDEAHKAIAAKLEAQDKKLDRILEKLDRK